MGAARGWIEMIKRFCGLGGINEAERFRHKLENQRLAWGLRRCWPQDAAMRRLARLMEGRE